MTLRALKLIARVLSLKTPPRSLVYSARNKINLWLGNGDRRFEFEKRYLEHGDVWNYETSDYERDKYSRTLDFIRSARRSNASVLEVGCSVGVFTELLAAEFEQVTAIDISREALVLAARHSRPNTRFMRSDIRQVPATSRYDVIVCAEISVLPAGRRCCAGDGQVGRLAFRSGHRGDCVRHCGFKVRCAIF